ncbi:MAG: hypothetical protein Q4A84_01145 [Neisseria sp.]|uniref:hypothetical protein n=1 Tax=Neisseria sp. TaxID=192066 RepID=UPI0026DCD954|nr:hypothetical protein [Neisseria sp.]MDO4640299.1 hypothetical protein [Neisseria sp.]
MGIPKRLLWLSVASSLLLIAGCNAREKEPKVIDGQSVHEIPFEQPLILKPETGQDFYFSLKGDEQRDYVIGVTTLVPVNDEHLREEQRKWTAVGENNRPGKDNLKFDLKVEYHIQGKVVPVQLTRIYGGKAALSKDGKPQWDSFVTYRYAHEFAKVINGVEIIPFNNSLVRFMPSEVPAESGGTYKVSIRPTAGIRYPKIGLKVFVEKNYIGK